MRDARHTLPDSPGRRALHLALLSGVALALPLFDVLSESADFFVAHRAGPARILALAALPCLVLPAASWAAEQAAGVFSARARDGLHLLFVGALLFLYALRVGNALLAPSPVLAFGGAAVLATAGTVAYTRSEGVQRYLTVLSPAALVIPGVFLATSPVAEILWPARTTAYPPVALLREPPIVLVVFDEFPLVSLLDAAGRIDSHRFPHFARLAATSYWFRHAGTVSDNTPGALTAIVAGELDGPRRMASYRAHPDTLFTLLADHYVFNAREVVTQLLPPELGATSGSAAPGRASALVGDAGVVYLHLVTPVALRVRLPTLEGRFRDFTSPSSPIREARRDWDHELYEADRGRVFRDFVASIRPDDRPTLHFHHSMLPHAPWVHLASGRRYDAPPSETSLRGFKPRVPGEARTQAVGPRRQPADPIAVAHRQEMHLAQVAYVDRLLGELLDHLEHEALFDESLLIVTADHGVAFVPGEFQRAPSEANLAEILYVPLFIKLPGQHQAIETNVNAQAIDLLPTVAHVLGAELPWPRPGVALFGAVPDRPFKPLYSRGAPRQRYPVVEARASLDRAIARNARRFDLDGHANASFLATPMHEALGRQLSEVGHHGDALAAEVDQIDALRDVRAEDPLLPAWVTGRVPLSPGAPPPRYVALVLNDVLQAISPLEPGTGDDTGRGRFAALLPEQGFRLGENRLDVFFLETGEDGGTRLRGR